MRKKIFLMMSMILSLTIYSGWNESKYKQYTLGNYIDLKAQIYGKSSHMLDFPNRIIIYKKKGQPLSFFVPGMFNWYTNSNSSMFAVHTDIITTGRDGIKLDLTSNSNIRHAFDWSGRRYFKTDVPHGSTIPINVTFQVDNSLDESRSVNVYWEARIEQTGGSGMKTTNQDITVMINLQLKAFDLDLGQHILGSSEPIEGSTKIYVEGEVFSEVELKLEESNIELLNENHQVADTYLDLDGSASVNVNLGSGGEAVVNLNGRVTNSLQDVGTYQGEVKITAKYI